MTALVGYFIAAWAAGYVVGYQVWVVRVAVNASS